MVLSTQYLSVTINSINARSGGSSRQAFAPLVLGVLLGVVALGIGVPAVAADAGTQSEAVIDDENVTDIYAGEIVEGAERVNDLEHTRDGGIIALEVSDGESRQTTVLRFNETGDLVSQDSVPGYLETITRVDNETYAAMGMRDDDVLLVWIHEDGIVERTETYGGGEVDMGMDIVSAPDGDAYILASTESFDVDTSDLWVLRVDGEGSVVWDQIVEHEKWTAFPKGERLDDGSLIATIRTERSMDGEIDGQQDVSVARIEPDGTVTWRTVVVGTGEPLDKEKMFDVVPAHGDGVLMVGGTNSGNSDDSNFDFWAARVDADGDLLWQRQYDDSARGFASAAVRTDDGYLIAGFEDNHQGASHGKLIAIAEDGSERFTTTYERGAELDDRFLGMDWTANGRLAVGGGTMNQAEDRLQSMAWLIDLSDAVSQVEPGPSTWETQHQAPDESFDDDDGGRGDSLVSEDTADASSDLVLYTAATISVGALFVPYGLRRLRRR